MMRFNQKKISESKVEFLQDSKKAEFDIGKGLVMVSGNAVRICKCNNTYLCVTLQSRASPSSPPPSCQSSVAQAYLARFISNLTLSTQRPLSTDLTCLRPWYLPASASLLVLVSC
jgi:hypothetical protein